MLMRLYSLLAIIVHFFLDNSALAFFKITQYKAQEIGMNQMRLGKQITEWVGYLLY